MGKSNKELKSNRIKVLRQQYDSFIEQDKVRKERNEYILGRLDKMRYSTALVPVRNKPTATMTLQEMYQMGWQPEVPPVNNVLPSAMPKKQINPDNLIQNLDETYLFQEISKKYILIPKLRSQTTNDYILQAPTVLSTDVTHDIHVQQTKTNNMIPSSNDWKSKYDILDILKKAEEDNNTMELSADASPKHLVDNISKSPLCGKTAANCDGIIATIQSNSGYEYLNEVPEKDVNDQNIRYEIKNNDEIRDPETHINTDNSNEDLVTSTDTVTEIADTLQNTNLEYSHFEASNTDPLEENLNYAEHNQYHTTIVPTDPVILDEQINDNMNYFEPVNEENQTFETNPVNETKKIIQNSYNTNLTPEIMAQFQSDSQNMKHTEEQDHNSEQVINFKELKEEVYNPPTVPGTESIDNIVYPAGNIASNVVQMKSSPDISCNENLTEQTEKHQQQPKTENPPDVEEVVITENTETFNAEQKEIEAFDAEQNEMFYSERPNAHYEYEQVSENAYDQEYSQNAPYQSIIENYPYYENTLDQAYPTEIDENEEQTLKYDQMYQQQYIDPYEKAYESKEPQKLQQPELHDEPQVYEQLQPEENLHNYESGQQVETVLDTEDGYIEQWQQQPGTNANQVEKSEPVLP